MHVAWCSAKMLYSLVDCRAFGGVVHLHVMYTGRSGDVPLETI